MATGNDARLKSGFTLEERRRFRAALDEFVDDAARELAHPPEAVVQAKLTPAQGNSLLREDLFSLQRWMGHQSIVTTQRYARHRPANFRGKLDDLSLGESPPKRWVAGGR